MRKTRKEIGDKTEIPLHGILSNEQLALMAQNPPKTKEDFLKIKGVNEQKCRQFGEIFLIAIKKALLTTEEAETVVSTCSTTAIEKAEKSADSQLDIF